LSAYVPNPAVSLLLAYIEKLEANHPGRMLPPRPATHAIHDLLLANFNGTVLPPAQRYCRVLARQVAQLLDAERVGEGRAVA
jgi:hypothetical protein